MRNQFMERGLDWYLPKGIRKPDKRSTAPTACKALSLKRSRRVERGEDAEEDEVGVEVEVEAEAEAEACRRRAWRLAWRAMVKDGTLTGSQSHGSGMSL